MEPQKTIFLDRDGVINFDSPDYIKNVDEFRFVPGAVEAIAKLSQAGYQIFIITNQSGISRNLFTLEDLANIHEFLIKTVEEAGGKIRGIFFCPHLPEENCDCRKPRVGLLERAKEIYGVNMKEAIMIGDSAKDVEAAMAVGCRKTVLVETGYTPLEKILPQLRLHTPDYIAVDLSDAVNWVLTVAP